MAAMGEVLHPKQDRLREPPVLKQFGAPVNSRQVTSRSRISRDEEYFRHSNPEKNSSAEGGRVGSLQPPPAGWPAAASVATRSWSGVIEIALNVIGTFGFAFGSALWVVGSAFEGTIIFAASCIFCGVACSIYAVKFSKTGDLVGAYALVQQAMGCFIFTTCSVLFLFPAYSTISLIGFFAASLLFLTGCVLTQVECKSWWGVLGPVIPNTVSVIPTSLFNSVGSVCFTLGSIFLFYEWAQDAGAWFYLIGSIVFFFASWGDATVWWSLGLTQSEHSQAAAKTAIEGYADTKFL